MRKTEMTKTVAILVAAGTGSRFSDTQQKRYSNIFGSPTIRYNQDKSLLIAAETSNTFNSTAQPKQYTNLHGLPIIYYSLNTFLNHPLTDKVLPVIHQEHINLFNKIIKEMKLIDHPKLLPYVIGGKERQDSVFNALKFLKDNHKESAKVLIHDCARPFVTSEIITKVIEAVSESAGALPVLTIYDSLKTINKQSEITGNANRDRLVKAQTPQGFPFAKLLAAYKDINKTIHTDDVKIFMKKSGNHVTIVDGSIYNNKITTMEDYRMLEQLTTTIEYRVGQGFDVHKLVENRDLYLCGVKIPHNLGLLGHSDADVAIHALVDAILGALALGDIGVHFPPSDSKWKDAPSKIFLEHSKKLLQKHNAKICNIDLTIICEEPKITPYSLQMRNSLADILEISPGLINVKATTTETLGFTGRKEGIASTAIVSLAVSKLNF